MLQFSAWNYLFFCFIVYFGISEYYISVRQKIKSRINRLYFSFVYSPLTKANAQAQRSAFTIHFPLFNHISWIIIKKKRTHPLKEKKIFFSIIQWVIPRHTNRSRSANIVWICKNSCAQNCTIYHSTPSSSFERRQRRHSPNNGNGNNNNNRNPWAKRWVILLIAIASQDISPHSSAARQIYSQLTLSEVWRRTISPLPISSLHNQRNYSAPCSE